MMAFRANGPPVAPLNLSRDGTCLAQCDGSGINSMYIRGVDIDRQ